MICLYLYVLLNYKIAMSNLDYSFLGEMCVSDIVFTFLLYLLFIPLTSSPGDL